MPAAVVQFVSKLWRLLEEAPEDGAVHWADDGTHFCVCRPELFAKQLLPLYYRHGKLSSFVRQVNLYGFRKLSTLRNACPRVGEGAWRYRHPRFVRHRPEDLHLIRRRAGTAVREQRRASKASAAPSPYEPASDEALTDAFAELGSLSGELMELEGRLGPVAEQSGQRSAQLADLLDAHRRQRDVVRRLLGLFSEALHAEPSALPSIRLEEAEEEEDEEEDAVQQKRPRLAPEAEEIWVPALAELEDELRLAAPLRPVGGWPTTTRPRDLLLQRASTSPTSLLTSCDSPEASPPDPCEPEVSLTRPSAADFSQFLCGLETSLSSLEELFAVPEPPPGSVPHRLTEELPGVSPSSDLLRCGTSVPDPSVSPSSAGGAGNPPEDLPAKAHNRRPLFCLPPLDVEELDNSSIATDASSCPHNAAVL